MDVKRGVYIGECSRLAVLCSTKENYIEALKDLNILYVQRGYPEKLVFAWCKKNAQERWDKRFTVRTQVDDGENQSVFVLKSRFDGVWNWFSATELGNTITSYWLEWYERASAGRYDHGRGNKFLPPDFDGPFENYPGLTATVLDSRGDEYFVPDIRAAGFTGAKWLVSRKRNANLFDLTTQWKRIVFQKMDDAVAEEGGAQPEDPKLDLVEAQLEAHRALAGTPPQEEVILLNRRSPSPGQDHPEFGRGSKFYH
jgi:hypothetical protein